MRLFVLLGSFLILGACSQFEPFVDARREAGQVASVGSSKPERPVVCSAYWDGEEERLDLAQRECEKIGKKAQSQTIQFFECKFFTPVKESFVCVEKN